MKLKVVIFVPAEVIHSCQAEDIQGHLPMPNRKIQGHLLSTRKGHLLANGGHSGYKIDSKVHKATHQVHCDKSKSTNKSRQIQSRIMTQWQS